MMSWKYWVSSELSEQTVPCQNYVTYSNRVMSKSANFSWYSVSSSPSWSGGCLVMILQKLIVDGYLHSLQWTLYLLSTVEGKTGWEKSLKLSWINPHLTQLYINFTTLLRYLQRSCKGGNNEQSRRISSCQKRNYLDPWGSFCLDGWRDWWGHKPNAS